MKNTLFVMKTDSVILVVDDFSTMRKIATKMLNKLGFEHVFQATSGREALEKLQREQIDVVLTDWNMPGMSGIELLEKIRSSNRYATIPVILITAEAEKQNIVTAIKKGASGYVLKPFNIERLQNALEKNLGE